MNSNLPRTSDIFLEPFRSDPEQLKIADNVRKYLKKWMNMPVSFEPHLSDSISADYGIVGDDLDELLLNALREYDLPEYGILGGENEVDSVREVVEYALAVAKRYPKRS
jgi:hypothetical protein